MALTQFNSLHKRISGTGDNGGDGFWFGTQSLNCLRSSSQERDTRRQGRGRVRFGRDTIRRPDWHYIHRLIYYRQHVFEWGAGARGYYIGPHAAVPDCPTQWEVQPAGRSACSYARLEDFATGYKRRYGGYNLIANNCHHFANRAAELLASNCTTLTTGDAEDAGDSRLPASTQMSDVMNWTWGMVTWVLSATDTAAV